jgi:hypothetical protein
MTLAALVLGEAWVLLAGGRVADTRRTIGMLKEAIVLWRGDHPGKRCPAALDELRPQYAGDMLLADAWKRPFAYQCPSPGHDGYLIVSRGADGRLDTPDDIRSDRR